MFVSCSFLDENGVPKGRKYTYGAPDDIVVGELATTPEGKRVVITEINVSPEAIKGFEGKIKGVLRVVESEADELVPSFDKQELITVEQLPIITERFRIAGEEVKRRVDEADSLVCTEQSKQLVKKARAQLRKEMSVFDTRFKEVKGEVLAPWSRTEEAYRQFIAIPYADADKRLKEKIDAIEDEQKKQKLKEIQAYFAEYAQSKHIDIVTWEQAGIKVGLSDSVSSLKGQAKAFIDRVESDLQLIDTQEYKAEILVEYKRSLNASQAITTVTARLKAIEEQKARQADIEAKKAAEAEAVKRVEGVAPKPLAPAVVKPIEQPEKECCVAFKVSGTKEEIIKIAKFLKENEVNYQQIPLKNIIESGVA